MNLTNNRHVEYIQPWAETIIIAPEGLVCDSPVPGGNEDIGYETWQ